MLLLTLSSLFNYKHINKIVTQFKTQEEVQNLIGKLLYSVMYPQNILTLNMMIYHNGGIVMNFR